MFNHTAMITGASQGLGRHIARVFTEQGFNTLLCARRMDPLQELADELNEQEPGDSIALPLDFHDTATLTDLSHSVPRQWPPISVLINNAGNYFHGALEETDLDEFQRLYEVNCQGPFILMKELVPEMASRGEGFVANILSSDALRGKANQSAYNASKSGLRSLTRTVAREYQAEGVHITGVVIDGRIGHSGSKHDSSLDDPRSLSPESIAREILRLYQQPPDAWTLEMDLRSRGGFRDTD